MVSVQSAAAIHQVYQAFGKQDEMQPSVPTPGQAVQTAVPVQWVFLLPLYNDSRVIIKAQEETDVAWLEALRLVENGPLAGYFCHQRQPATGLEISRYFSENGRLLTEDEQRLVDEPTIQLLVPIFNEAGVCSLLLIGPKSKQDGTSKHPLASTIEQQAELMLENAYLIQELQNQTSELQKYQRQVMEAREAERKALARELHDQILQQLVGFRYEIADIQAKLGLDQLKPNVNTQVDQLQDMIQGLIQMTRALCQNLRPPLLDLGLIASIRALVHRIELKANIPIQLTISGERETAIDEDITLCLHRCTQEALINACKHANPKEILIQIEITPEAVEVIIKDDGCGFAVPKRLGSLMHDNHFGLVGMRERVEMLNGVLQIRSAPQNGTHIYINIPRKSQPHDF